MFIETSKQLDCFHYTIQFIKFEIVTTTTTATTTMMMTTTTTTTTTLRIVKKSHMLNMRLLYTMSLIMLTADVRVLIRR